MKPPHNVAALERALRQLASTDEGGVQLRFLLSSVVAGQFLEGAVMRGGASLKLRYGSATTRFTKDFDAARNISEDDFVERFNAKLSAGWAGFSGRIVKKSKAKPKDLPAKYVMQPFEVKLTYNNNPWCTVWLELSYNEVGDADECESVELQQDVIELFEKLNLPRPRPIPLMKIAYQVAQKIHGATDKEYVRANDLVDLQLIFARESVNLEEVAVICKRLFANRKKQDWPSYIEVSDEWRVDYEALRQSLPVLDSADDAIRWANDLIAKIAGEAVRHPTE